MKETIWIYPGSFDPITLGHVNIIERASRLCGRLIIGVLENRGKTSLFSADERVNMIRDVVKHLENVDVVSFSGLQTDFYTGCHADAVVRGIRDSKDYDYELTLDRGIQLLLPEYEIVFLAADIRYYGVSSSVVRELAAFGGELSEFVPESVADKLRDKFKENYL